MRAVVRYITQYHPTAMNAMVRYLWLKMLMDYTGF